ncbi:MAG: 30S ribosomal protein S18 [Candidatus Omnitrophica bacterium]|nr:30S ribosomal protein S18 [Candidatus Omnitrophota bacterium]
MAVKKAAKKTRRIFKKKPCKLCKENIESIDFLRDVDLLSRFQSDRGKIVPSRITGNCAKHQRMVANGIKRARIAGLLPFVKVKEGFARRPGRRSRG